MRKIKRKVVSFVVVFSIMFQLLNLTGIAAAAAPYLNTDSYLIGLKNGKDLDKFIQKRGYQTKKTKRAKNINVLAVELNQNEMQNLQNDSDIAFVELDAAVEIASRGKVDKKHESVAKMQPQKQSIPWGIEDIGVIPALENRIVGKKIKVAVLDTGIAMHKDLRVAGGISFVEGVTGYQDDNGHGTHVAGTIAALNNDYGVVGAASKADIYSVKVLDETGSGTYGQVIQGIEWAIEKNVNIISMSFGGSVYSQALHEAIKQADAKGVLVIAAAGNAGAGQDTMVYPAKYPEVISVGAVDRNHAKASFSSTGPELDLVAPGVEILSTTFDGGYGVLSGTSMATPHVTGAAAALWSQNPGLVGENIKQKLYENATPLGNINEYGHGLVDLDRALGFESSPIVPPQPPAEPPQPSGEFNIIDQDQKFLEQNNKLLDLIQQAKDMGEVGLAKNIEKEYNELLIFNAQLHKVPSELNKFSKTDIALKNEAENNYYTGLKDSFLKLENQYTQVIGQFADQVANKANTIKNNISQVDPESTDVNLSSYEFVGDGQTIAPGGSATVSLRLFEAKTAVYINVFNVNTPSTIIASTTKTNLAANATVSYTWYTSTATPEGTYRIQYTYPNITTVEYFTIYVKKSTTIYTLSTNSPVDVSLGSGQYRLYTYKPSTSGMYKIFTGPYGGYGGSNDTYLELYSDPNLTNRIAYNDDANGTLFSEIRYELTGGTTYYVKLRHYSSTGSVYARLTATLEYAITTLSYAVPIDVDIASGGNKIFKFTPPSTGKYKINTTYFGGTSTSGVNDTILYLYSDVNLTNQIGYNDDSNGTLFSEIQYIMTGGTSYYIKLAGFGGGSVHARINTAVIPVPPFATLSNKTPVDISKPVGQEAYFKFTPSTSGLYRFFTEGYQGTGAENDTYLHLYSDMYLSNQLAYNDDVPNGPYGSLFSKIEYNLTAGTPYYIKVRHYSSSGVLTARFTVEDDFDSIKANATPKDWDQGISDNLSSRYDVDYYRLQVVDNTEDIRLYIDTNAIALEDSNSNTLARFVPGDQETLYSATIPGTYYAKVFYYSGAQSLSSNEVSSQAAAAYNARCLNAWIDINSVSKTAVVGTPGSLNKSMSISWRYSSSHPNTQVRIYNRDHSVLVYYKDYYNLPAGVNKITWNGTANANVEQEAVNIGGQWIARDGNYSVHIIPQDYLSIYFRKDIIVKNTSPVILIGGIGGSVLDSKYLLQNGSWSYDLAWLRATSQNEFINTRLALRYDSIAKTVSQNDPNSVVWPRSSNDGLDGVEYIAPDAYLLGKDHLYDDLMRDLEGLGYTAGLTMYGFPYDWRLSNNVHASALNNKIDEAIADSGSANVIIVSHSMGGIVTKEFLRQYPGNQYKINKWITLGTPHLGSPKAVKALIDGYNFDASLIISKEAGRRLAMHSPAVYQLLPSEKYYTVMGSSDYMLYYTVNGTSTQTKSYSTVSNVLSNVHTGAVDEYLNYQEGLQTLAQNYHSTWDSNISTVKMYQIVGDNVPTPLGWLYPTNVSSFYGLSTQEPAPLIGRGDGTVPRISGDAVGTNYNTTVYYYHGTTTHGALPTDPDVCQKVINIINGRESAPVNNITSTCNTAPLSLNAFTFDLQQGANLEVSSVDGQISKVSVESTGIKTQQGNIPIQVDCYGSKVWVYVPSDTAVSVTLNTTDQNEKELEIYEIRNGQYQNKYVARGKDRVNVENNLTNGTFVKGTDVLAGTAVQ